MGGGGRYELFGVLDGAEEGSAKLVVDPANVVDCYRGLEVR